MNKLCVISTFLLLLSLTSLSHPIDIARAQQVARNFIQYQQQSYYPEHTRIFSVTGSFAEPEEMHPSLFIFNLAPSGYVVVAADDASYPVLAYSYNGYLDRGNRPPALQMWLDHYHHQIDWIRTHDIQPTHEITNEWDRITNHPSIRYSSFVIRNLSIDPLITSIWNQDIYYNEMCPPDPAGPGGHCYAGCVATAMGQVMYYYRWPITGTGSYTYNCPGYGTLTADFGSTTYLWENMTDEISSSNPGVAELLHHLGVSVDMQYGPDGSGMYNHKAAYSLRTFFKYSPETQYIYRDSTTMDWDSLLIAHLDRQMPMYYAGWSVPNINGHAFVCDGYQGTDFFHFNWGWSGSFDGYFYTDNLNPGGYNFNLAQEVIIHCFPDTVAYTYPSYCTGNKTLDYKVGSLEDGSGPVDDYLPGTNCSWLIDPQNIQDSITSITLNFVRFSTNPGDVVSIYDGESTAAPLLGTFSGTALPPAVTSNGNKLFITFTSTAGSSREGWYATYTSTSPVWCTGTTIIESEGETISDGSFSFYYQNKANCKWKILPPSEAPVTLHFSSFDTEAYNDVLKIYDQQSGALLAEYSGTYTPPNLPPCVVCNSGKMFLVFSSNQTITAQGWEAYFETPFTGISHPEVDEMMLYPNPVKDLLTIQIGHCPPGKVDITIFSSNGLSVFSSSIRHNGSHFEKAIDLSTLSPGLYLLSLKMTSAVIWRRIIISH